MTDISNVLAILVSILGSFLASSGFWLYVDKRREKRTLQTELLIGLAHDRIANIGLSYINRGWINEDEYENLHDYLYKPYLQLGGNGSAKRIMAEVDKLPIRKNRISDKVTGDTLP